MTNGVYEAVVDLFSALSSGGQEYNDDGRNSHVCLGNGDLASKEAGGNIRTEAFGTPTEPSIGNLARHVLHLFFPDLCGLSATCIRRGVD